jgi:tRNA(fMet)-specific endonuclease VapC
MNYILDTNIVSELIAKQPNQTVIEWIKTLNPENLFLSVITIGHLRKRL